MERKIETVTITTTDGRIAIFDVVENPGTFAGRRAYVSGKTLYYDEAVFEAGLINAAKVERTPA